MNEQMNEQIEALITAHDYIENLYSGVENAISEFRSMQPSEKGNELTVQIIDGLKWLIEIISLTQEAQVKKIDVMEIRPLVEEALEALKNKDMVLIADVLEYELLYKLQKWYDDIWITIKELNEH